MNTLSRKKVLIVGATGFIGRNLTEKLSRKKCQVSILLRNKKDIIRFSNLDAKFFVGSLSSIAKLKQATKNIDIVFNCSGALPHHRLSDNLYKKTNVDGVKNLMDVCLKNKVKLVVHLSTVGIYGNISKNTSELSVPKPVDVYSKSKLAGDEIVYLYRKKGLKTVIIRPTIAYGPGDTRPAIFGMVKLIKYNLFVPIGSGKNFFHTVFIDNLIQAIILSATKKSAVNEDFIIGDIPCPRARTLWSKIAKNLGKKLLPVYVPKFMAYLGLGLFFKRQVNFLSENKKYNTSKAVRLLNYKPKVSLTIGVKKTILWYKMQGLI